ncbi:hypothetical protein HNE05_07855 [Aquipseudomonas campi]|uniref:Uncharacterized protein n=1 Tax=Aquipseudomonas campi TaxID=2731681 RepID=A0A6M8FEL2_9GAMM|nr:hypothetical protein [Pseudomonas campi]QKE63277.1 hypothetical protein HNE05_07855 [Pseudomonas campi]
MKSALTVGASSAREAFALPGFASRARSYSGITPVVYLDLVLDRLRHRVNRWRGVRSDAALDTPV